MALDINYIGQLTTFTQGMKGYYSALSLNFTSATNPLPMFEDVVSTFDYSEILRHAQSYQKGSANFMAGAMVDTIHDIMSVQREFGIRNKGRSAYFSDSISDSASDSSYYDMSYVTNLNLFKGTSPDQQ